MRSVIFRSIAVIGAGAVILAGVLYVASTVDGRSPTVLDVRLTQPLPDDDRLALVTTSVEIAFSEPVDAVSAERAVELVPDVAAAASWSGSTLTITPVEALQLDTDYVVTIASGIRDTAGNEMGDAPPDFEFATVGPPVLAAANPPDGTTDVPLDGPVALTFSTLMDTASVGAALQIEPAFPHELRWAGRLLMIVPTQALAPGTDYRVAVSARATDVAGVRLRQPAAVAFRTVAAGLEVQAIVPDIGIDGIATTSPIAVIFDEPLDPDSLSGELLTLTPEVAGTLEVIAMPGDPSSEDGAGRALVFTPSAPLPPNTTFSVEVLPGMLGVGGEALPGPLNWTFTTGVSAGAVSNQVTFVTARSGVANVWAMNPDGSGQRQLSAELAPVVDYVVAPTGDSLVVSDGWRLVYLRADGSERRVLTGADTLEFDPAFSPDGRLLAFARADAATGAGLGLWEWQVGGGDPESISLPADEVGESASPVPAASRDVSGALLRAPRYSPDGETLAFVDGSGAVGLLDLADDRLTLHPFAAGGPPFWLPDASAILITGQPTGDVVDVVSAPVLPMRAGPDDAVHSVPASTAGEASPLFSSGSEVIAVAVDGRVAYVEDGELWLSDLGRAGPGGRILVNVRIRSGAFAPGGSELVVEIEEASRSTVELVDPASGDRTELVTDARRPRWHP